MTTAEYKYPTMSLNFLNLKEIGEGSFGIVFLAEIKNNSKLEMLSMSEENSDKTNFKDEKYKKNEPKKQNWNGNANHYALKKLKPLIRKKNVAADMPLIENYPEVRIMRALRHPNLMNIRQIVEDNIDFEQSHYLVLDFGIELMEFARHKEVSLSTQQIRCAIAQIVDGLDHMHSSGFMHRDVKPSNIYLFPDGTTKLGDFSISRSLKDRDPPSGAEVLTEEQADKLKQKTLGITTRQYRAPEVMFGSRYYDESIDIWGLGCTVAQFILHQMIFPGTSDIGTLQLIFQLIGSPRDIWPQAQELPYYLDYGSIKPTGIRSLLVNSPSDLIDFIELLLTLNPKKRPTTKDLKAHPYLTKGNPMLAKQELGKITYYLYQKKLKQIPQHSE